MNLDTFFDTLFGSGFLHGWLYEKSEALFYIIGFSICIIIPYLLGSINFAIIISRKNYAEDIRSQGSGNAGMTNMMRTYGTHAAVMTFVGDALKAVLSCLVGYAALGQYGAYIAGIFCILGHMYPAFFGFKGGKGVVTTAATMLMCDPLVFLINLVLYVAIVAIWKYISLASIMCAMLYPIILNGVHMVIFNIPASPYAIFAFIMAIIVVFKHRDNISRLLNKTENKFSFKKSVTKKNDSDK